MIKMNDVALKKELTLKQCDGNKDKAIDYWINKCNSLEGELFEFGNKYFKLKKDYDRNLIDLKEQSKEYINSLGPLTEKEFKDAKEWLMEFGVSPSVLKAYYIVVSLDLVQRLVLTVEQGVQFEEQSTKTYIATKIRQQLNVIQSQQKVENVDHSVVDKIMLMVAGMLERSDLK